MSINKPAPTLSATQPPAKASRLLFVNLAVRDLPKAKAFFTQLGFTYNPKYTDENAACMIFSDNACVMLLTQPFFQGFTKRELCDTTRASEGLFAFSCGSRAEVDELVNKALAAGGKPAMDQKDYGFMYNWSFLDLDGHHWEVMWMDPQAA
ncbi:MAG TPA: VOC family protein [Opitutaceae bacterium]